MNAVDATDRTDGQATVEPPALLSIIIDTNPHAWALLDRSLSLSQLVANLLVFINAHLAINHANQVAVLASHAECARFLYPAPTRNGSQADGRTGRRGPVDNGDADAGDADADDPVEMQTEPRRPTATTHGGPVQGPDDANKYRPFAHIEHALTHNLRILMNKTRPDALSSSPATMLAGALTMALTYISKQSAGFPTADASAQFNYSDPNAVAGGHEGNPRAGSRPNHGMIGLSSRILILSVSGDLAEQYLPMMNAIFACQRLSIPIDILKLAGDTVLLQQAADATGGIYMALSDGTGPDRTGAEQTRAGILQYLMFAYLPDQTSREHLTVPGEGGAVDFRAACFCHRKVLDQGFVCSICLSIFCDPLHDGICLTCGSPLAMASFGQRPVVVARKRKKRKSRPLEGSTTPDSRAKTPVPEGVKE